MPFDRDHFLRHRPWLYHFTNPGNLGTLLKEGALLSAAEWVRRANSFVPGQIADPQGFLSEARRSSVALRVASGEVVTLNDQLPLSNRSSFYALSVTYEEYIRYLNGLVFFWPGKDDAPAPRGNLANIFRKRYADYGLLRVPTADAWGSNAPRFCRYNSGAPQKRDRIVRGPAIFVSPSSLFTRQVAEVVFDKQIRVGDGAQWRPPGSTTWEMLGAVSAQRMQT